MDTYFIRHKFPGDEKDLCDARRIAIRFENHRILGKQTDLNPDWFRGLSPRYASTYRSALNYMIRLRDQGGYVFAEYGGGYIGKHRHRDIGCILARIKPQDQFDVFNASANDFTYQVALKLDPSSVGYIRYSEFPVLLAIRPPYSTICRPSRTYPQIAAAFFNRERLPATEALELMHPKMVEQLCVEYLRRRGHENDLLDYCTLRPGKSLAIIDIAGRLSSKRWLFAQVKNASLSANYSSELASQLESFIGESIGDNAVGVLFGKFEGAQNYDGPISFVDLKEVFQYFRKQQKAVLEDMIGFGAVETDDGPIPMDVDWAG